MSDKLLTTREVADRLGRSREFVMTLIRQRRLSCMRQGGRYYVHEWSLEELCKPQAAAEAPRFPKAVRVRGRRVA